jgi:hypothetical protein
VDTSAPDGRRYGEPDWQTRPVEYRNYGVGALFGNPGLIDVSGFPKYTEKSYEEWKVEGLIERLATSLILKRVAADRFYGGMMNLEDESKSSLAFGNPLVM